MNITHSFTIGAALLAAAALPVSAFGNSDGQPSNQQEANQQQMKQQLSNPRSSSAQQNQQRGQNSNGNSPAGYVYFEEDAVYLMANEPQNHFARAVEDFNQNKKKNAAAEMDIAADYLHMLSTANKGAANQDLDKCAQKLHSKADDVRNGKISSAQQLSSAFAEAQFGMARHFDQGATTALKNNKQVRAGHDLKAAATSLRDALAWQTQTGNNQQAGNNPQASNHQKSMEQEAKTIHEAIATGNRLISERPQQSQNSSQNQQSGNNASGNNGNNPSSASDPQQVAQQLGDCINNLDQQTASARD
ncbi:MAG: hypothetical protein ACTHN5_24170 [Phycisphaerae bacterium]